MAGYGYNGFGGAYGGYGGGNIYQESEQERIGYGPQGYVVVVVFFFSPINLRSSLCRFGLYEQNMESNRNLYTGATSVVQDNEFMPLGGGGYGGYGYGYGGGYGNTFF
jgi:hypothetical protein